MSRKREDWVSEQGRIERTHANLEDRELVLVIGALIEAALAGLLCKRLHGPAKGVQDMVDRMQFDQLIRISWAVGIIGETQSKLIEAFKAIRNEMAHKINVNLLAQAKTDRLRNLYDLLDPLVRARGIEEAVLWAKIKEAMPTDRAACRLLLRIFQHLLEDEFMARTADCPEIESLCGDGSRIADLSLTSS